MIIMLPHLVSLYLIFWYVATIVYWTYVFSISSQLLKVFINKSKHYQIADYEDENYVMTYYKKHILEMLCWLHIYVRGCFNCQLKMSFSCMWYTNGQLMYPLAYSPRLVQHTLTVRLCYHTHGKLIFNWRLMYPPAYTYSPTQHL